MAMVRARRTGRREHEKLARTDQADEAGRSTLAVRPRRKAKLVAEPLERGFGMTLGNACAACCCPRCKALP
jgi:hypothetical protein